MSIQAFPVFTAKSLLTTLNSEFKKDGIPEITRQTLYRWLSHPQGKTTDVGVKEFYTVEDLERLRVFGKAMFTSGRYGYAQKVLAEWSKAQCQ